MSLLSKALRERFAAAGLVDKTVPPSMSMTLGEWLQIYGIEEAHPLLEQYFGVPYRSLSGEVRLATVVLAAHEAWTLYYAPMMQCYYCLQPPTKDEAAAFRTAYGEAPLYVTDAVSVHSALLRGVLPQQQLGQGGGQRIYELEVLARQGANHVDGMIGQLFIEAIGQEATDVHLYSSHGDFYIDFRVHGVLQPYVVLRQTAADALLNKLKLMAEMDIAEHRLPQDGHIQISHRGAVYHLRLGTLPLLDGEKIVVRILPEQQRLTDLSALGFERAQCETMQSLLHQGQGLLLITGPTNSGKTTTLYACLGQLAQEGALVYTIEDPVEAILPQVQQSQVNVRGGYGFADGLRGMLRSDPDVLAVGELRDAETVDIAARAALSGHLVVATLHAYDAHQAVNRLRDLGLSDLLLSAVLLAVVNQRLVGKPCADCGGSGVAEDGRCCVHCLGSGSDGRMGIQEVWVPTNEERGHIERGTSSVRLRQQAMENGFKSLSVVAREKGVIDIGNGVLA